MHIWDMLASCSERWLGDKGNNRNNIQIMSVPTMEVWMGHRGSSPPHWWLVGTIPVVLWYQFGVTF